MSLTIKKQNKLMLPRGYLSYTQIALWEKDENEYIKIYLHNKEKQNNKYQKFGKEIHENLENGKKDFISEHIKLLTPDYEREAEIRTTGDIPLFGIIDGMRSDKGIIGDYKTGKKWTQKQTDESEQLTFYNLLFYEKFKKIPVLSHIHWIETREECGVIFPTGKIETFDTVRTLRDILKIKVKIKKVAEKIDERIKKELKL